jgi:DNA-binding Lrp family transcriptional regulator
MISGKLDEIDLKILNILQKDASIDVAKLATMVNRTPNPIHERIRKLIDTGIIRKFTTILDRTQIGQPVLVILMVRLKEQNTQRMLEFEQMISGMPQVQSCLTVSGSWNFILQVTAATPQEYAIWLLEKVNINPNVGNVESAFVMKEVKNYGGFQLT